MVDRFFVRKEMPKDVLSTEAYHPDNAVRGYKLLNPSSKRLCVVIPPWHDGEPFVDILARRLARNGESVVRYSFHDEILKPDVQQVSDSFRRIQQVVGEDLGALSKGRRDVRAIALSLGNPALSLITEKFEGFSSVSFVSPGSSLAVCMWDGARTQHIREELESQGTTLPSLEVAWDNLSMANRTAPLEGRDVNLLISNRDNVIPTRYQQDYVNVLKHGGIQPNVQTTWLGHYATIGNFCLRGNL